MANRKRGTRGSGKSRKLTNRSAPVNDAALTANVMEVQEFANWILSLCLIRYEWVGLPESCDERYLETSLALTGCATICHKERMPGVPMTLKAGAFSKYNAYNNPVEWMAMGDNGEEFFPVKAGVNGVFVWDRYSRLCFWPKLYRLAGKLARYSRTEDVNLFQQFTPSIVTAPEEKILDVQTAFASFASGQPAIVGYDGLADIISKGINVIQLGVEWKGEQFQRGALGVWSEIFRLIGIPHVMFEKNERMNNDESQTGYTPARLMLDDGLKARQKAAEEYNKLANTNISVRISEYLAGVYEKGGAADGIAGIRTAGDQPGMA